VQHRAGAPPADPSLLTLADRVLCLAESLQRFGFLVTVSDVEGDGKAAPMPADGFLVVPRTVMGPAQVGQRDRLAVPVAQIAVDREALLMESDGGVEPAALLVDQTEAVEDPRLTATVIDPAADRRRKRRWCD
jgi:hypothetical protein